MKSRTWIVIFAVVVLACAGALVWMQGLEPGETAEIYSQGELYGTIDLSRDTSFVITVDGGENTVTVRDGQIYVTAASCPDQVCVAHGAAAAGSPVVCLPNELVISVSGDGVDASTGS